MYEEYSLQDILQMDDHERKELVLEDRLMSPFLHADKVFLLMHVIPILVTNLDPKIYKEIEQEFLQGIQPSEPKEVKK